MDEVFDCPHCGVRMSPVQTNVHNLPRWGSQPINRTLASALCPACGNPLIFLEEAGPSALKRRIRIFPMRTTRHIPPGVPAEIARLFHEASGTLVSSKRASAALGRMCLQKVLLHKVGVPEGIPFDRQVGEAATRVPEYLGESLRTLLAVLGKANAVSALANVEGEAGGSSAHDAGDPSVVHDVHPAEPEWTLNVLQLLFDHYYGQPNKARQAIKVLEQRLNRPARSAAAPGGEEDAK